MGDLSDAVAAADSFYAIFAIAIIGFYVLAWKWGGELLRLVRDSHEKATEAKDLAEEVRDQTSKISSDIATNHGSKSLGDAVDRITEWFIEYKEQRRQIDERITALHAAFYAHIVEGESTKESILRKFVDMERRIHDVERLNDGSAD